MSVITALTAQNTQGVDGIHHVPPEFVRKQLESLTLDIEIDAFKIGMLGNRAVVQAVSDHFRSLPTRAPIVLDPVMVSTSGSLLLEAAAIETLIHNLLPNCDLLTPNLQEAAVLLRAQELAELKQQISDEELHATPKHKIATISDMLIAAEKIGRMGPRAVLLKGGHSKFDQKHVIDALVTDHGTLEPCRTQREHGMEEFESSDGRVTLLSSAERPWSQVLDSFNARPAAQVVCDILYEPKQSRQHWTILMKPLIECTATHGTGCTLSSAIASYLAAGASVIGATRSGAEYVQTAIANGLQKLGKGPGPLNHSGSLLARAIPYPNQISSSEQYPLIRSLIGSCLHDWRDFVQHRFVKEIEDGSLPKDAFLWFLEQDYLFLVKYANVWAVAAAKADSFEDVKRFSALSMAMADEAELHVKLCEKWGIKREVLQQQTVESAATLAYTRFVLDVAHRHGCLEILVATLPCMLGYAEVGHLTRHALAREDHCYREWIETYSGEDFSRTVRMVVGEQSGCFVGASSNLLLARQTASKIWRPQPA